MGHMFTQIGVTNAKTVPWSIYKNEYILLEKWVRNLLIKWGILERQGKRYTLEQILNEENVNTYIEEGNIIQITRKELSMLYSRNLLKEIIFKQINDLARFHEYTQTEKLPGALISWLKDNYNIKAQAYASWINFEEKFEFDTVIYTEQKDILFYRTNDKQGTNYECSLLADIRHLQKKINKKFINILLLNVKINSKVCLKRF